MSGKRIYLDHAATSWPKCPKALQAAQEFIADCGATAGRGSYTSAQLADSWLLRARNEVGQLLGCSATHQIAFCHSGTHALNALLLGLIRPGDRVLTSESEHNSVLRPLHWMREEAGVELHLVPSNGAAIASLADADAILSKSPDGQTSWIALTHASNVTGAVQDLAEWSNLARRHNTRLIVDASQTLGYLPIDLDSLQIAGLASAGHKGLRALAGTGLVAVCNELIDSLRPIMRGGTGVSSEQIAAPPEWPHTIEVGNLNLPGIVSMAAAAKSLNESPAYDVWKPQFKKLIQGLRNQSSIHIFGDRTMTNDQTERMPLASLRVEGWDNHDLANVLDTSFGIECRSGFHCAGAIHPRLNGAETGTLRLSVGHSTTLEEIETTLQAFECILH